MKIGMFGDTKSVPAYLSTSFDEKYAKTFYNVANKDKTTTPLMMEMRVPIGTNSIYIGANTAYQKGNEYELLLGRGLNYKVVDKQKRRIVIEVIS